MVRPNVEIGENKNVKKKGKVMSNRRMTFGMYKGREINDVISENPKYIEWCLHFVSFFFTYRKRADFIIKRYTIIHSKKKH